MSLKYQRVKQADLALPRPLRWLTRAFSSITLAVVLLSLVALYGVIASIPVAMLALAGLYALIILGCAIVAATVLFLGTRALRGRSPGWLTGLLVAAVVALAVVAAWVLCARVMFTFTELAWYQTNRAMLIYRLPAFEMTELAFYSWWPMQMLLGLFVVNMIWATVRRIAFRFENIGVLCVHTGIVILAIGSIFYGRFKVEGDMFLLRRDLGGGFHNSFYDVFEPALYLVDEHGDSVMVPLPRLPRYNDYPLGSLDMALHASPQVKDLLGEQVRLRIPGFLAYAHQQQLWEVPDPQGPRPSVTHGPSVQFSPGTRDQAADTSPEDSIRLVADVPADRVHETPRYAIELLHDLSEQRLDDLNTPMPGLHGLIVEIPELGVREVLDLFPGQRYALGDTGYTLQVELIGPYDMPFVTQGYEGAQDTQVRVRVTGPDTDFRRIVLHRYPARSQDFVPSTAPGSGPMGQRRDPDPRFRMVYLDNSRTQYRLLMDGDSPQLTWHLRIAGTPPMTVPLLEDKFPLPGAMGEQTWMHVVSVDELVVPALQAVSVPRALRTSRDEGTFVNSLLPLLVEKLDRPASDPQAQVTWDTLIWLSHLRYPHLAEPDRSPAITHIPGVGPITLSFSRVRHPLPFAIALEDFEMIPIPGSDIEQDFIADLLIAPVDPDGLIRQQPSMYRASMNHPLMYRTPGAPLPMARMKISQIQWDRGDTSDPMRFARDEQGRFINQQRFTVLGIANNVGIRIIAFGAILVALGIPWAFWVKPWLLRRRAGGANSAVTATLTRS